MEGGFEWKKLKIGKYSVELVPILNKLYFKLTRYTYLRIKIVFFKTHTLAEKVGIPA